MARVDKYEQVFQGLSIQSPEEINGRLIKKTILEHPNYSGNPELQVALMGGHTQLHIQVLGDEYVEGKPIFSVMRLSDEDGLIAKEVIETHRVVGGGPVFEDEEERIQIDAAVELLKQLSAGAISGNTPKQRAAIQLARLMAEAEDLDFTQITTIAQARNYWLNHSVRNDVANSSTLAQARTAFLAYMDLSTEMMLTMMMFLQALVTVSEEDSLF